MAEKEIPDFEAFHEDENIPRLARIGGNPTETIDLSDLNLDDAQTQDSFSVERVDSTSIGKLLHALPLPILLIDSNMVVVYANQAAATIAHNTRQLTGASAESLFTRPAFLQKMKAMIREVMLTRKPRVIQGLIHLSQKALWGRLHFRSFRIGPQRMVLFLVEDLTLEKRQLLVKEQHEKSLRIAQEGLERRVHERTKELSESNRKLRREIAQRQRAEDKLTAMVATLEETLNSTVVALAAMAEKRDPYTAGHQRRVAQLACTIAQELRLPEDQINGIAIAAAIHDIGKIAIPSELLSKPGEINEYEYGIIKAHPEVAYDILKEIQFPWPLADIVLQHHERWDGNGYPKGLKGHEILLGARIISVADVVEAMVSHRPYRVALGQEKAIEELKRQRGQAYDGNVVNACISSLRKGFTFD